MTLTEAQQRLRAGEPVYIAAYISDWATSLTVIKVDRVKSTKGCIYGRISGSGEWLRAVDEKLHATAEAANQHILDRSV